VRLGKSVRKKAEKIGGSVSSRLVESLEEIIGAPVLVKEKKWYEYNRELGKWEQLTSGRDKYRPQALQVQELSNVNSRRAKDLLNHFEDKHIDENAKLVGAINHSPMICGKGNHLINFANGVGKFNTESGELVEWMEHKPEFMFTMNLASYVDGKDCELFKQILKEILPLEADRLLFLNFFTCALLPNSRFEIALFCLGSGANGKSVLTEAVARAFGTEARSAIKLHQICGNDRKYVWKLENRLVNIATETDTKIIEDNSIFKNIVSGERFETDRLYREGVMMHTNVKLCFVMNEAPKFKHGTDAENRRLRMIYFAKKFDEDNRDLDLWKKLANEASGIISYLVRRLPKVAKMDDLGRGSLASERAYTQFQTNNNLVSTFLEKCITISLQSGSLPRVTVWRIFEEFCRVRDENNWLNRDSFFRQIRKLHPEMNVRFPVRYQSVLTNHIKNVRLTDYGQLLLEGIAVESLHISEGKKIILTKK
jgi:P4 family phage/plasmid primase-like protien